MENNDVRASIAAKLYNWQQHDTGGFYDLLFRMISNADKDNIRRLKLAFPFEVDVFHEWHNTTPEINFFTKYGVIEWG